MRAVSLLMLAGITLVGSALRGETERNFWPFWVAEAPAAKRWTAIGPLLYAQPVPPERKAGATRISGLRPVFSRSFDESGRTREADFLYPLFTYRSWADGYRSSVLSVINFHRAGGSGAGAGQSGFDLWPFYFARDTGDPATSYRAVLPLYGSVRHRFGQDRLTWVAFPLYARWEKNLVTTTTAPWPFFKHLSGEGNRGFELWPLFGQRSKEGAYRESFYLWPLIYHKQTELWKSQPNVRAGFLPFFAAAESEEGRSRSYLWPFFGYTERVSPYRYRQVDYLWPFFAQGRGDDRRVNRWAPFYTHSVIKGTDKRWILWPVWRQLSWEDRGLRHTRRQLLYFVFNDNEQSRAAQPLQPSARKTHLWPLLSYWDNGAGQKQLQALSPLEVFFPSNEAVRHNYSPFFAVYRYSHNGPDQVRHSVLWNLATYRRDANAREFHLGPLFSTSSQPSRKRYTIGGGLLSLASERKQGKPSWRIRLFDFKSPKHGPSPAAPKP